MLGDRSSQHVARENARASPQQKTAITADTNEIRLSSRDRSDSQLFAPVMKLCCLAISVALIRHVERGLQVDVKTSKEKDMFSNGDQQ